MRLKTLYLLAVATVVMAFSAKAQISEGGTPPSIQYQERMTRAEVPLYVVAPPDMERINKEDWEITDKHKIYRIGELLDAQIDLFDHGTWTVLPNGDKLCRLSIKSEGALGLGLYYDRFHIPEGGKMWVYNENRLHVIGAYTSFNNPLNAKCASEKVQGEVITIEYLQPRYVTVPADIMIGQIGYFYRNCEYLRQFEGMTQRNNVNVGQGGADPCHVNANCSEGDNFRDPQRSAVKIEVVSGGSIGMCSGAMVNNTDLDCKPYFLTADHCDGSGSTTDAGFSQWLFFFGYESPGCANGAQPTPTGCVSGAQFRSRSGNGQQNGGDFLLLEFVNAVPDAWNPYFAGWDKSGVASPSGVSFHHPNGDIKKISTYTSTLQNDQWNGGPPNTHWRVTWAATANGHSVTMGGSSGSPIFDNNGRLVGDLTGGSSYCTSTSSPDLYGKFSYNWDQNGASAAQQLKPWLDPGNTGVNFMDGSNSPCAPAVADDAGITAIIAPNGTLCSTTFTPEVTLRNFGSNTLSSATINYNIDGAGGQTFPWTGSLAPGATTNVTLAAMTTTAGAHTFQAYTTQPNGTTDGNTNNDTTTINFSSAGAGAITVTLSLTPDNYGSDITWQLNDAGGTTLFSGGPYTDGNTNTITETWCLAPGCYDFVIADVYGDGICCTEGNGTYVITDGGGAQLVTTTGTYGSGETQNFCVGASPLTADFTANVQTVCEGTTVNFTDATTGAPTGWTWTFIGGAPASSTQQNPTVTYSTAGTYAVTLVATDGSGTDTKSEPNYITVNANPTASATGTDANCGQSNGAATASAAGGSNPYTYAWSPSGGSSATATGLAAGTYTVTVTDANTCTGTANVTIADIGAPTLSANGTDVSCNGLSDGSATASVSGASGSETYSWSPSGGTSATATGLAAGTYTVTVTDNGCAVNQQVTINEPTVVAATTTSTNANCGASDGTATVNATGGAGNFTYAWSPSGGTSATTTGLAAGNYTVTVTDGSGCSTTESVTVGGGGNISLSSSVVDETCGNGNGSATVTVGSGSGNYSYNWSSGGTSATETGIGAGTYTVIVTDQGNGCIDTATVTITNTGGVTASASPNQTICAGDNVILTAGGGTGFSWDDGSGVVGTSQTLAVTPTQTTSYTVTVSDQFGCTDQQTVVVTVNAIPTTTVCCDQTICEGDVITLTASGGASYFWNTTETTSTITVSPTSQTTYSVIASNGSCSGNLALVTISVDPSPTAVAGSDVTATSLAAGGVVNFNSTGSLGTSYAWDFGDGSTSSQQSEAHTYTAVGTYMVTLTVTLGNCIAVDTLYIDITEDGVGIDEDALEEAVQVYPNPTNSQFQIKVPMEGREKISINVYNGIGELIEIVNDNGKEIYTVDLQNHPTGIYYVTIHINDLSAVTKRVSLVK